jgi:hypothetical protein
LKTSQPIHIKKNGRSCSEENIEAVADQPFDKEIVGSAHEINQPSPKKAGL